MSSRRGTVSPNSLMAFFRMRLRVGPESILLAFSRTGPPYDGVECHNTLDDWNMARIVLTITNDLNSRKKYNRCIHFEHILFVFSDHDSLSSMIAPRYLYEWPMSTSDPLMFLWKLVMLDEDLLFSKVKYEFSGFADIQQEVMFATPFYHAINLTDVILLVSVCYQANYGSVISIGPLQFLFFVIKPLVYNINNTADRTHPWGDPMFIINVDEILPSTNTNCVAMWS